MASQSQPNLQRRWLLRLTAAAVSVWLCHTAQPAWAEPQPTAAERETARALMQEGDQLSATGDHRAALERYSAAHALVRIPTTGLEVARAQVKLGLFVEARGLAMELSSTSAKPGEPAVFARARAAAGELARDLAARIPSVRTQVSPNQAAYSLTIDGVKLPNEARSIAFRTNPGTHVIIVAAPGFVTERKELPLAERQAAVLSVALTPAPLSKAPAPGKLNAVR